MDRNFVAKSGDLLLFEGKFTMNPKLDLLGMLIFACSPSAAMPQIW